MLFRSKAAKRHAYEINRLLRETNFSDSTYQIKIEPAKNENGQFFDMLMAEELDSKNLDNAGIDGQISFGEDAFYQKYEQKIKLLTKLFDFGCNTEKKLQQLDMESILKIPGITIPDMALIIEFQKETKANKLFSYLGGGADEQQTSQ